TRFCVNPKEEVSDIPIIGGTKNPRLDKIKALQPDLVIANKEENRPDDVKQLMDHCEVEVTDIATIDDALIAIHKLGEKLGIAENADELIPRIQQRLAVRPDEPVLRTAYMIWKDPCMSIGADTYIHDVMKRYKLDNVFEEKRRYPTSDLEEH